MAEEYSREVRQECPDCDAERPFILNIRTLDEYECDKCGKTLPLEKVLNENDHGRPAIVRVHTIYSDEDDDDSDSPLPI